MGSSLLIQLHLPDAGLMYLHLFLFLFLPVVPPDGFRAGGLEML